MKPLVLVTEKLKDYFQSKPLSQDQDPLLSENEKVFASFKANFEREASEDLKEKLNRLTLKDRLSTTEIEKLNEKRKLSPTLITKQIKLKRFSNIEEKNLLSNDFLGPTTKYIEKFMEGSKEKWQVARCFVTNMIEVVLNSINLLKF